MRSLIKLIRLLQITRVFAKSGLLLTFYSINKKSLFIITSFCFAPVTTLRLISNLNRDVEFNVKLREHLQHLGPIFIKFGQTLSTRPDIVGIHLAEHLKSLQDQLIPFSAKEAIEIIETQLGLKLEQLFSEFNTASVAAASIAQVHKARLLNDEWVAVKILRPNVVINYYNDIQLLKFITKWVNYFFAHSKRLRLTEVVKIFENTMHQELNLTREAAACSELRDNLKNEMDIVVPKVYWDYCTESILTLEWIDGVSIYNQEAILKLKLDPSELAKKVAISFFNQAYRDGFFHSDLHPGNILVCPNGQIAILDFGIMGRLPERDRLAIAEILHAFIQRDYKRVAELHVKVNYVPSNTNVMVFAQACRAVAEPILGKSVSQISIGKLLGRLFKITEEFGMQTQPQLLLLQKTMVVVEGIGQLLDPEVNMWFLAEPWVKRWAAKNITPEAKILRLIKQVSHRLEMSLDERDI